MTRDELQIREGLRSGRLSPNEALVLVRAKLAAGETSSLLVLQGILSQISEEPGATLEEAQASFERAVELAPDNPEPYEELGHFFDAVMSDREKAERFYRLALDRGAGPSCREALDELLAE